MNKEQIDRIALRVADEKGLPTRGSQTMSGWSGDDISEFTHALLAELAKVSEPVEIIWPEYHEEGMGCGLEDRNITDRYEAMRHGWDCAIERCAEAIPETLFEHPPLQQPGLVAEIGQAQAELTQAKDELAMTLRVSSELRQQLSAAQAGETELLTALEEIADLKGTEQCEWDAAENVMPGMALISEKAIATHKSRKE